MNVDKFTDYIQQLIRTFEIYVVYDSNNDYNMILKK